MSTKGSCDFSKSDILSCLFRTGPCVGVVAKDQSKGALFPLASALVAHRNVNIAAMQREETRFPPLRIRCFFCVSVSF